MSPLRRESLIWCMVVIISIISLSVYGIERPEHRNFISILVLIESTTTLFGIVLAVFAKYLWYLPVFKVWLVLAPDLRGEWEGTVAPIASDGEVGKPIACKLRIRQSLFSIKCIFETESATSRSFTGIAYTDEETGIGSLVYSYRTRPRLADGTKNPSHDGTAVLSQSSQDVLVGTYFTDRCTRGELTLARLSKATK